MPRTHRLSLRRRRRSAAFLSCLLLAVGAAVVQSGAADASANPYAIDGNVPNAGAAELTDLFGSVKELGPKNSSATKIGVIHKAAKPMLDLTNPNAQVDLRRAWIDLTRVAGDDWLYFAWERDANTGSGFISFEFSRNPVSAGCGDYSGSNASLIANCNPWENRAGDPQPGDFLLLWDQQGGSRDIYVRVWSGTAPNLTLGAPVKITDPAVAAAQYGSNGFRGEAAVNLTALHLTDGNDCQAFANVIPSTVTGNSDTADYKDTILDTLPPISNCEATIVTTPKKGNGDAIPGGGLSIGTGVVAVSDSAEISLSGGSAAPTGSISFHLCKIDVGTCTSGGTSVGSTSIAGGAFPRTVSSPTAYVTAAGRYCWRAEWPGDTDAGIPGTSDSAASECFTVNPVNSSLATSAGPDVILGNTVSDSATLSGTATRPADPVINTTGAAGAPAGGTITFKLYGPSADGCGTLVYTSPTVAVSGDGTYDTPNPQFEPQDIGEYHWVAVYSGSPNTNGTDHNTACGDDNEAVNVEDVPSTLSTSQTWVPNDSATVSADEGGDLLGTVTFEFFDNGTCTGDPVWSEDVAVDGPSEQTVGTSNAAAVDASGDFSWRVTYDSDNPAQRDIPSSCDEVSGLTIDNGDSHTSP